MMRRLLNTAILNVEDNAKIKATKEIEVNGKQLAKVEQIPTKTSDLTNDSDFITIADIPAVPEVDNRRIKKAVAIPNGSPEPSLVVNIDTDVDTLIVFTPIPNVDGAQGFQDYSLVLSTTHLKDYVNKIMYLAYDSSDSHIKITSVQDNTYSIQVNWFNTGIGANHALSIIVL